MRVSSQHRIHNSTFVNAAHGRIWGKLNLLLNPEMEKKFLQLQIPRFLLEVERSPHLPRLLFITLVAGRTEKGQALGIIRNSMALPQSFWCFLEWADGTLGFPCPPCPCPSVVICGNTTIASFTFV